MKFSDYHDGTHVGVTHNGSYKVTWSEGDFIGWIYFAKEIVGSIETRDGAPLTRAGVEEGIDIFRSEQKVYDTMKQVNAGDIDVRKVVVG